jgi:putative DNA primase/helicase
MHSLPPLDRIAKLLGGDVRSGEVVCPGPGHSRGDRSLAVKFSPDGNFVCHSFAADDAIVCRNYVRERLGLPKLERQGWCDIWREARHPCGTIVEAYLNSRSLALPPEAAGEAIRFHVSCPFGRMRTPAMIALVRDIRTNKPVAIHRTALDRLGRKITIDGKDRMALGPIKNGAVKLTPDEAVTDALGVGEGIESTLSLRHTEEWQGSPVWALLSASGVAHFPLIASVNALMIAVDRDDAGQRAARELTQRWHDAGRDVRLLVPTVSGADLNDSI